MTAADASEESVERFLHPFVDLSTPLARTLWLDCTAGAIVGVLVLAFREPLGRLHGLPEGVLVLLGAANLVYAAYSFSLARDPGRTLLRIEVLVYANAAWAVVCLGLAMRYGGGASAFGFLHLIGEAMFVGALAVVEWRQRRRWVGDGPTTT